MFFQWRVVPPHSCDNAGEYGDQIFSKTQLLQGEEAISASPKDLVNLLGTVLQKPRIDPISVEYILTALMKLSARLPEQSDAIKVHFTQNLVEIGVSVRCVLYSTKPFTVANFFL